MPGPGPGPGRCAARRDWQQGPCPSLGFVDGKDFRVFGLGAAVWHGSRGMQKSCDQAPAQSSLLSRVNVASAFEAKLGLAAVALVNPKGLQNCYTASSLRSHICIKHCATQTLPSYGHSAMSLALSLPSAADSWRVLCAAGCFKHSGTRLCKRLSLQLYQSVRVLSAECN